MNCAHKGIHKCVPVKQASKETILCESTSIPQALSTETHALPFPLLYSINNRSSQTSWANYLKLSFHIYYDSKLCHFVITYCHACKTTFNILAYSQSHTVLSRNQQRESMNVEMCPFLILNSYTSAAYQDSRKDNLKHIVHSRFIIYNIQHPKCLTEKIFPYVSLLSQGQRAPSVKKPCCSGQYSMKAK